MTKLIRLGSHPKDAEVVVLRTPPDMSKQMGGFGPARFNQDLGAYLIHESNLEALRSWVRYLGDIHVIDERRGDGTRNLPHECAGCGQPGSIERAPKFCPSCGADWRPITYEDASPTLTQGTCSACGHRQAGRFPRCSGCGGQMTYPEAGPRVEVARTKLADPMPLGEAIAETTEVLQPEESK
jgi:hypothetical protein